MLARISQIDLLFLFVFYRISARIPFIPSAFQGIHLLKAGIDKLLRHTGAGSFIVSGAIEDDRFVLRILVFPFINL